ncbi:MAG: hypothetical protein ACPGXK_03335 [Phycisphaerae bacterium]
MTTDAENALKLESEFLAGMESNFADVKGKLFQADSWKREEKDDEDRLRSLMASHRNYDKRLLRRLPKNRSVRLEGYDKRWFFWNVRTGVAVASVVTPLEHFASGNTDDAPPVSLGDLIDHVQRLQKEQGSRNDQRVRQVIGVCSPTGFSDDARTARFELPNGGCVVLIEPDGVGGWITHSTDDGTPEALLTLFDPERNTQKVERVHAFLEERSADLLTGGLTASSVAEKVRLSEPLVQQAFEVIEKADPEIRLTRKEGEVILFRGAPVSRQEKSSMSVIDRIRQLLSGEGDENDKINVLAERRATLAQRRDRIYEDISKLETREAELLAQGRAATSSVPKRRLAAQLAQLRKDIARQNTTAAMLNKQIDIISTDIHNLTLIKQGQAAQLPDTEELTEHAVQAEEMLETLNADADLVSGLETGIEASMASDEELAILAEFDAEPDSVAAKTDGEKTDVFEQASEPAVSEFTPEEPESEPKSKERGEQERGAEPN